MVYAYLQTAQDAAAKKIVDEMEAGQPSASQTAPATGPAGLAGGFPRAAIPARYALERGAWAEAVVLETHASNQPYVEAMTHFARALGAARAGTPDAATNDIEQLVALHQKEIQAKDAYWATQVDIERQAAQAWILWAQGSKDQALKLLASSAALEDTTDKSAVTPGPLAPAHELLGEMLLEAKQPAPALREFEASLKKEPNRFRSVYGAGRAAELSGDRQKARSYYVQLVKICERGDVPGRVDLQHAREYLRAASGSRPPGLGR
jgi:tetratricopeptide (TPR) repeat protein